MRVAVVMVWLGGMGCLSAEIAEISKGEAKSAVVVSTVGGESRAWAAGVGSALGAAVENLGPSRVWLFTESLEDLALSPGPLELPEPGRLAYPLPAAERVYASSPGQATTAIDAPGRLWIAGRRKVTARCPRMTVRTSSTSTSDWFTGAALLDDGSMFVTQSDGVWGRFYRARPDSLEVLPLPRELPRDSVVRHPNGDILLSGCVTEPLAHLVPLPSGELEIQMGQPCAVNHVYDEQAVVRLVQGELPDGRTERMGLTRGTTLVEYQGDAAIPIAEFGLNNFWFDFMEWVGPSSTITTFSDPEIIWWRNGGPDYVRPEFNEPHEGELKLYRASRLDFGVTLLGDFDGKGAILSWDPSSAAWYVADVVSANGIVRDIRPLDGGGYAIVGDAGSIGYFSFETGYCPVEERALRISSFYAANPAPDDRALVFGASVDTGGDKDRVWWLEVERVEL